MCCFYSKSFPLTPDLNLTSLRMLGIQVEMGQVRRETERVSSCCVLAVLTGWQTATAAAGTWTFNAGALLTGWVGWGNPGPGLPPPGGWGLSLQWGRVCDCAPFRPPRGGRVLWQHKEMSQQRKAWPLQWHWPPKELLYCSVNSEKRRKIKSSISRVRKKFKPKDTQYSQLVLSRTLRTSWDWGNCMLFMGSFQISVYDYWWCPHCFFRHSSSLVDKFGLYYS